MAGFKYFDFETKTPAKIEVTVRGYASGRMDVFDAETGGDLLAQIPLDMEASDWITVSAPIHAKGKKTALFFRYEGEGALDLYSFNLE